jgi:8-oxo-dGTP pyrophosphatase MutT (NUDIX family)
MEREISAGGVVLQPISGVWHVALIEPRKDEPQINEPQTESLKPASLKTPRKRSRARLTLPKGLVDAGEKPQAAAVREVLEETGLIAEPVTKLADNKYVYVRTWGDGKRVFKIVSFYLMRYVSGEIDNLASEMRIEVKRALWVPLTDAASQLAYSNERKVLRQAEDYLQNHGLS